MENDWLDVRDGLPKMGEECVIIYGDGGGQLTTLAAIVEEGIVGGGYDVFWLSEKGPIYTCDVTYYKLVGPLPDPPMPRGPLRIYQEFLSDRSEPIAHFQWRMAFGEESHKLPSDASEIKDFNDWLDDMDAKRDKF